MAYQEVCVSSHSWLLLLPLSLRRFAPFRSVHCLLVRDQPSCDIAVLAPADSFPALSSPNPSLPLPVRN